MNIKILVKNYAEETVKFRNLWIGDCNMTCKSIARQRLQHMVQHATVEQWDYATHS